jgi:hypothetical protein
LIRAIGWFQFAVALCVAVYLLVEVVSSREPVREWYQVEGVNFAIAAAYLLVGSALKRHASWSRWAGGILAIVALGDFPVGTVLGPVVVWFLVRGRHEHSAKQVESGVA